MIYASCMINCLILTGLSYGTGKLFNYRLLKNVYVDFIINLSYMIWKSIVS